MTVTCSACFARLTIFIDGLGGAEVSTEIPSNGKRGNLFVAAHTVTVDAIDDGFEDGDLIYWDCPACGYADSHQKEL